jgi:translation initiation factor IF-3
MDYGRFKYEQTKKEREARKNQKVVELKEVRMTPRTDEHDILAKVKKILGFLEEGDKVKVTIRFRGRELAHPQLGRQVLEQVTENLKNGAVIERQPMFEGRSMFMILAPPGSRPPQGQPRPAPEAAAQDQPVPAGVGPRPAAPVPNGPAPAVRAPSPGPGPHPQSAPSHAAPPRPAQGAPGTRHPAPGTQPQAGGSRQPAPDTRPQPASSAPPPGPPRPRS